MIECSTKQWNELRSDSLMIECSTKQWNELRSDSLMIECSTKQWNELRSDSLMIECSTKQQSLNLLSQEQIHAINFSTSPHRILNRNRGVV
jgi:hypothetical protein